jgi:hypothetical protein
MFMSNGNRKLVMLAVLLALGLLIAPLASAQTTMRPIEDFVNAQSCMWGWGEPDGNSLWIDYLAYWEPALGLGGTVSGYVKEQVQKKTGGTKISIVLHTSDAITRGWDNQGYEIFGYSVGDVYYNGAEAAVGDVVFTAEIISDQPPGSPLPNLCGLLPGEAWTKTSVVINADGPLRADFGVPEGTPGKAHTTQKLRTVPGLGSPHDDSFPVEKVRIWEAGN